jgi:hypothetical protein
MRRPPVINTLAGVQAKLKLVEALDDIKAAMKLIQTKQTRGEPAADRHYRQLDCSLAPLAKKSTEYKMLTKYLQNTHGSSHRQYKMELLDAFAVSAASRSLEKSWQMLLARKPVVAIAFTDVFDVVGRWTRIHSTKEARIRCCCGMDLGSPTGVASFPKVSLNARGYSDQSEHGFALMADASFWLQVSVSLPQRSVRMVV